MRPNSRPSDEEHAELLKLLGPLPIQGAAWPRWIKITAWVMLALIAFQFVITATGPNGQNVNPYVAASLVICYAGMVVIARYMTTSVTRITDQGIEQSWIGQRSVRWEDIQFAKFIPLVSSKKLVCFVSRARPVVFQGGTRELQTAFAQISLVYRRR